MNRQRMTLTLATIVLGMGTVANASANQSSIEDSLSKAIVTQTKQVSGRIASELKQSIHAQLQAIVESTNKQSTSTKPVIAQVNQVTKKSTAAEE